MKLKSYLNRQDRNNFLFMVGFMGQAHDIIQQWKNRIVPESEHDLLVSAEANVSIVLEAILKRMEENQKGFAAQMMKDSQKVEIQMFVPGVNYIENKGQNMVISKPLVKELLEASAMRCLGCLGDQDKCELRRLKEIVDERPMNENSNVCPYTMAAEEMDCDLDDDDEPMGLVVECSDCGRTIPLRDSYPRGEKDVCRECDAKYPGCPVGTRGTKGPRGIDSKSYLEYIKQ